MASSRSRRRSSSDRRSPRASSSRRRPANDKNQVFVIGGSVAALVVVGLVFIMAGGGSGAEAAGGGASDDRPAEVTAPDAQPKPAPRAQPLSGTARSGRTPDRPAPTIEDAQLQTAQQHYTTAKEHWNTAQRARTKGDHATFKAELHLAADAMFAQRDALRDYTDWYEEADLSEWEMPGEYVALESRLAPYDRLFQRIKKVMPR